MKKMILIILILVSIISCAKKSTVKPENQQSESVGYYLNSETGDDSNTGKSPQSAWRSIDRLNRGVLVAGDHVFFQGGQVFTGTITLDKYDGGKEGNPIIIASYGNGRAVVNAGNERALSALETRHATVRNIEFKGQGRKSGNTNPGLYLYECDELHIDSVEVHGFQKAGIDVVDSRGVQITHSYLHNNGSAGIETNAWKKTVDNIYIGYCLAENNPGDPTRLDNHSGNGILLGGVNGGVVEYCRATNNGWDMPRAGNGPVGIWAWHSNKVLIQYCIADHNKTSPKGKDGGGFDFDGGVTNSILQYNLSYENEGAGFGLFQFSGANKWENNIIRYNISYHDGKKNGQCGFFIWAATGNEDNLSNAWIYNNTVVNRYGHGVQYLLAKPIKGFVFSNNIFFSAKEQVHGKWQGAQFLNNLYWSSEEPRFLMDGETSLAAWARKTGQELRSGILAGVEADPLLILPQDLTITDPTKLAELEYFKTAEGSPCNSTGVRMVSHADTDFWGTTVPEEKPDIGAFQH